MIFPAVSSTSSSSRTSAINESSTDVIESLNNDKLTEASGLLKNGSASKLETLIYIIQNYYYKDIDNNDLVNGVYKGLVEGLDDPYSAYYTADEYKDLMQTLTGNYAGSIEKKYKINPRSLTDTTITVNPETTPVQIFGEQPDVVVNPEITPEVIYQNEYADI